MLILCQKFSMYWKLSWATLIGLFSVLGDPFLGTWSTWSRWSSTRRYVSASTSRPRANGRRWALRQQQCTVAVTVTVASRLFSLSSAATLFAAVCRYSCSSQQSLSLSLSPLVLATCFYSILPSPAATHTRILFAEFYKNLEHVLGNFGAVRATKIAQRVGRTLAAFSGVLLWRQVG
jgi:hypothetical protein